MEKENKSLELSCYVAGAGAFGVFFRWMQLQLAYNDNDLPDKSAWNFLVPLLMAVGAFVFYRFVKGMKKRHKVVPDDFFAALKNEGKIYAVCRWAIGSAMIAGGVWLFFSCETDLNSVFLRILAVLGILTGVSFPLLLTMANKPHITGNSAKLLLSVVPVLFSGMWLLTCYKQNSINPVQWDFVVEIITVIITLSAFLNVAGFAYNVPNWKKSMFYCMFGAMLCIMSLADSRYMGQQVMFASAAFMMLMYNWIMIANSQTDVKAPFEGINDGDAAENR